MLLRLFLLLSSGLALSYILGAADAQFAGSVLVSTVDDGVHLAQAYYPPPGSPPVYSPPAVSPPPVDVPPPPTINQPTWQTPTWDTPSNYPTRNYPTTYYR